MDPVANRDVDAFILVVAFLVGHVSDQLLVDPAPDIGQIDGVHAETPLVEADSMVEAGRQSMERPPLTGR
jgi:hypothetical protein